MKQPAGPAEILNNNGEVPIVVIPELGYASVQADPRNFNQTTAGPSISQYWCLGAGIVNRLNIVRPEQYNPPDYAPTPPPVVPYPSGNVNIVNPGGTPPIQGSYFYQTDPSTWEGIEEQGSDYW